MTPKNLRASVFWVLREKESNFCLHDFSENWYVASIINHADYLIYLHACLHKHDYMGLIGKPDIKHPSYIKLQSNNFSGENMCYSSNNM